ncbi:kinase-like protein [Guyanagaster necrorhizus]|uniref:Kinase-like protein n=1 Tax=Guyanagaster necrorhizus TaxID=856835 RepID=A0A9P8ANV0_9AGAR|nr:kinase-like protein [Guyanagaster necrorhizus MCA 3950]KAG7442131.1 kinase-like protein [Guyanagaster necrorhizus MCA 3950]
MTSIGIVCLWMANGTLVDFLKHRQTKLENSEELRLRLLIQVCSGLMYLHSKNTVHGDLHGGNVLVDSDGCASLADFGLSTMWRPTLGSPRACNLTGGDALCLHPCADIYSAGDVPYSYYMNIVFSVQSLQVRNRDVLPSRRRISRMHYALASRLQAGLKEELPTSVSNYYLSVRIASVSPSDL